jgi:hypothetical protein
MDKRVKHGLGGRYGRHPLFNTWAKMRARCSSPSSPDYHRYGERGILVCERWKDFAAFVEDMGEKPSPSHSIERIDNDGPYSPDNCKWATKLEQSRNQRKRAIADTCKRGHDLTGDNVYSRPDGKRGCRTCRRINMKNYYGRQEASHA